MNRSSGGNFDWVAPIYDALSFVVFGQKLQRAQTVFLGCVPPGASVLMVGGGTGQLLEHLLVQRRPGHVLFLETSVRMLALASRRIVQKAALGTVEFRLGDETNLSTDDRFEVLLTPFVLDLFTEETLQRQFIPCLYNALKPGGLWIVTDFVQTSVWWQRALLWSMIRFFRVTAGIESRQLADWQRMLVEAGLTRRELRPQVSGMVSAEVWEKPAPAIPAP